MLTGHGMSHVLCFAEMSMLHPCGCILQLLKAAGPALCWCKMLPQSTGHMPVQLQHVCPCSFCPALCRAAVICPMEGY